ncbi:hypothetical protein VNO77_23352 [Canavalia gladiata]|uniref:Uncharacterized protein n=1 Tax=Canavalia gladiata TaxID=3824 RepID=A0AAN9L4C6_CANGL
MWKDNRKPQLYDSAAKMMFIFTWVGSVFCPNHKEGPKGKLDWLAWLVNGAWLTWLGGKLGSCGLGGSLGSLKRMDLLKMSFGAKGGSNPHPRRTQQRPQPLGQPFDYAFNTLN